MRLALAWVLVDETFGLTVAAARRGEPDLVAYKAAVDLLLFSGWVAGTAVGVAFGGRFDPAAWGADVFFAVLFVGLAAPLVRGRWDLAGGGPGGRGHLRRHGAARGLADHRGGGGGGRGRDGAAR